MPANKSLEIWVETASFSENLILGFAQTLLICTAAVTLSSQICREYLMQDIHLGVIMEIQ